MLLSTACKGTLQCQLLDLRNVLMADGMTLQYSALFSTQGWDDIILQYFFNIIHTALQYFTKKCNARIITIILIILMILIITTATTMIYLKVLEE